MTNTDTATARPQLEAVLSEMAPGRAYEVRRAIEHLRAGGTIRLPIAMGYCDLVDKDGKVTATVSRWVIGLLKEHKLAKPAPGHGNDYHLHT